jgi:hypothetical protein
LSQGRLALVSPYISVAEDIEHLRVDWDKDPKSDVVRRGSAILRRLLLESVLHAAWRHHGFSKQPIIKAPDLLLMAGRRPQDVEIGLAGGAHHGGMFSAGMMMMKGPEPAVIPTDCDQSWLMARPWPLSDFISSPAVIVDGVVVKRCDIITYFANIAGGVHLTRSSRVRKKNEELVRRLTRIEGRIRIHQSEGLYFELLSIGQALGKSDDVIKLAEMIRNAA